MKSLFSVFLLVILLCSCKKNNQQIFQNNGVITGVNLLTCPCTASCPCGCGGLFFHFTDTSYTSNIPLDNPSIFKLGTNIKFPVYVKLNWENTTRCGATAIKVTSYKIL